ncbi:MAG: glycosidase [Syntrophomonas sp.]
MSSDISEILFDQSIAEALNQARNFPEVDLVIAVPFYNEKDALLQVLSTVQLGLRSAQPLRAALMLCVGDPAGSEVLEAMQEARFDIPHIEFLMKPGANGRGASIRAILEICRVLESDVVILAADLKQIDERGFQPEWVNRLIEPIRGEYDLSLAVFDRHYNEDVVGSLLAAPLLEAFYKVSLRDPLSGVYAISHDLLEDYCLEIKFWTDITQGYGIDPWMVSRAVIWQDKICEVRLGAKLSSVSLEKLNFIFKEIAEALFTCIKRDVKFWAKRQPVVQYPDHYGNGFTDRPLIVEDMSHVLTMAFKRYYEQYHRLYEQVLPAPIKEEIEKTAASPAGFKESGGLSSESWADLVYHFLLEYSFNQTLQADDLLNALTFAFDGRLARYMSESQLLEDAWPGKKDPERLYKFQEALAHSQKESQKQFFVHLWKAFYSQWVHRAIESKPPLTPTYYLEFIPGLPVILPKQIEGKGGKVVRTEEVFNKLQARYQEAFNHYIFVRLTGEASEPQYLKSPAAILPPTFFIEKIQGLMENLEHSLESLLPGDLYTEDGTAQFVDAVFSLQPFPKIFAVKTEVLEEMLHRFPPLNVMIPAGCRTAQELIDKMDVRDAVTLANLLENRKYADRALLWILDVLTPEKMDFVEIKPIILGSRLLNDAVSQASISDLNKLTTRITVNHLSKGLGGAYPRLRFFLYILRHIMIAQDYSHLWKAYARERKNLGDKLRNSLIGLYHTTAFSAHNIFENMHHRSVVSFVKDLISSLEARGELETAHNLQLLMEGYGLSQVLDDGTFLPCSAWTWASYGYKGGKGVPTPMSSQVEEKWFNHDLLEELQAELGYQLDDISHLVEQLIGEGRASENLLDILVGVKPTDVTVVPQDLAEFPPALALRRAPNNPLLLPIKDHAWESRYVLNAAAVRIEGKVYILYRAFGEDETSRIGLAISDGYHILERLEDPVFAPANENEKRGCEDPRVVIINGELIMLYTAYDGQVAQIAAASIPIDDFVNYRFEKWKRIGLAFNGIWDKDAILFPERINGKYVIYHRIEPSVWVSYLDELVFPAPKENHAIIFGPRSGYMWDSLKIGAGTQPIKTEFGWLMIYHGVDRKLVYRLGVILVDYQNPERLLYRSPNPILSPEAECELGSEGCWVPNVVFTCGAVPAEDKETLGADDELLVYYGASDTYVCLATAKVGELIPESIRNSIIQRRRSTLDVGNKG